MDLPQLEAFEAVARERNFTRAAESLFLTQPAVTRQVAALESELKTRLFDRLGRTVRLTASGEALHRYAEVILRLTREARAAVIDIGAGTGGRITLGASSTLATYVLPPILWDFRRAHPRVELAVHTGKSGDVLQRVRANEVDLGLITSGEAAVRDPLLVPTLLADYETRVVVPPGHLLADQTNQATVPASVLADHLLILMNTGTNLRAYADGLLSAACVTNASVAMELDNVEAIKRMIEAGLGVSLLPEVSVRDEAASGRLVALRLADVPRASRRIALVHRRDKYLPAALRAFADLVQTRIGPDPDTVPTG